MRSLSFLAAGIGIAATAALVGYFGVGAVLHSLAAVGLAGFVAVCAIHLALIAAMGVAWGALLPGVDCRVLIWARLVRDSTSEVLPLSQVGGYVLGARAAILGGISATLAAATTIVDVTLEFVAQIAYTALGLLWLVRIQPDNAVAVPVAGGLAVAALAATAFLVVQRRGLFYLDRIARVLGRGWAERTAAGTAALHEALAATYQRRAGLIAGFALHLACWLASVSEAWVILRLIGSPLPFGAVLALESLMYAVRTVAFIVPNAVGVQEGAYIVLGAALGLGPDTALALSLLKRARDLVIGLPAIGAWQIAEGGRLWRRRSGGGAKPSPLPAARRK